MREVGPPLHNPKGRGLLEPSITTAWSEGAESGAEILSGIVVGLLYFLPLTKGHARDVRTE